MTKNKYTPSNQFVRDVCIFDDYEDDENMLCSQFWVLTDIWENRVGQNEIAYAFLAFRNVSNGKWQEYPIELRREHLKVSELLMRYSRWDYDQYFCPNLFSKPRRKSEFALPTSFGWCDIDDSEPYEYDPHPSLVWETSPSRYQALWEWDSVHTPSEAEEYSKALAYRHGGDTNGWSATKMLRLIGSVNHKPQYKEPFVKLRHYDWTSISDRPKLLSRRRNRVFAALPAVDANPTEFNRALVIERYRKELHPKVRYLLSNDRVREPDRSAQIFHMIAGLHEAGASPDEIACVLWDSPYFIEKHGQDIDKLNDELARVIGKLGGAK